jgi:hypothetical protein
VVNFHRDELDAHFTCNVRFQSLLEERDFMAAGGGSSSNNFPIIRAKNLTSTSGLSSGMRLAPLAFAYHSYIFMFSMARSDPEVC